MSLLSLLPSANAQDNCQISSEASPDYLEGFVNILFTFTEAVSFSCSCASPLVGHEFYEGRDHSTCEAMWPGDRGGFSFRYDSLSHPDAFQLCDLEEMVVTL